MENKSKNIKTRGQPYKNLFAKAKKHSLYKNAYDESKSKILLGEALYKARVEMDISMAELAKKANTTAAVISRIENAQVNPGFVLVSKIFAALGKQVQFV